MSTKKGGGGIKNKGGEGVDQRTLLTNLETLLNETAVGTAKILGTNYNTYKEWKGHRREMLGTTLKLIEAITLLAGTELGKKLGV